MKRFGILLLLTLSLALMAPLASGQENLGTKLDESPSMALEALPAETPLEITAGGIKIKTTVGKFLGSYDEAYDEGLKDGIAEERPKREVAEKDYALLFPRYETAKKVRNVALIGDLVLPVLGYIVGRLDVH